MPWDTILTDGKNRVEITKSGNLPVVERFPDVPNFRHKNQYRYFNELLKRMPFLTSDMSVDGSVNAAKFEIKQNKDYDIHITGISIVIEDDIVQHHGIGGVGAVGNGWDLYLEDESETIYIIESATTFAEMLFQVGYPRPFGSDTNAWQITDYTAATGAQFLYIPIEYQGGFRIGINSANKLVSKINDDLTGLTSFYARAIGYRHYPTETKQ